MCLCDVINNKFVDVDDDDFTFPPSLLVRILELEARCYFVSSATIANIIVVIIFNIRIKSNYEGGILGFFPGQYRNVAMAFNVESYCACICLCLCLCVFVFVLVLWPWHNANSDCAVICSGFPRVNMEKLPLTLVFPKTQFPDSDFWIIYESSVYCSHSHIFEIDHIALTI